jgi:hypothetical protein
MVKHQLIARLGQGPEGQPAAVSISLGKGAHGGENPTRRPGYFGQAMRKTGGPAVGRYRQVDAAGRPWRPKCRSSRKGWGNIAVIKRPNAIKFRAADEGAMHIHETPFGMSTLPLR